MLSLSPPPSGIASTRVEQHAKYLAKKGNNVTVSCIFDPLKKEKPKSSYWNGINIISFTPLVLKLNPFTMIFNLLSLIFTQWIPFVLSRPDVVIISVPPGESSLGAFLLAKLFRIKQIYFDYRDEWEDYAIVNSKSRLFKSCYRFLKKLMNNCYNASTLTITVTDSVSNELRNRGIQNNVVITNGTDTSIFKPSSSKDNIRIHLGLDSNDFVLIYSGLLGEYYNIENVLYAIKTLIPKIPKLKLLLLGDGPSRDKLIDLAISLGLATNVIYLGRKSNRIEVAQIVAASDVGMVPYHENNISFLNLNKAIPVKFLEYMSCGIPIIATVDNSSLVGQLIVKYGVGLISPPGDVKMLADNIDKMYRDRNLLHTAGNKGKELVRDTFDINRLSEKLLYLIETRRQV